MNVNVEAAKAFGGQLLALLEAAQFQGSSWQEVARLGAFVTALADGEVRIGDPAKG